MRVSHDEFGDLMLRHSAAAYRVARAIVQSHADAEEVVQNALLQAYLHRNDFRGDANVRTWLVAIVRNQAISYIRFQRRHRRRAWTVSLDEDPAVAHAISREPSPEDLLLHRERRERLSRCIDSLPCQLRDAFRLVHFGDYTYKEAAAMMRVPTGTLKSRVWDARRTITRDLRGLSRRGRAIPDRMSCHSLGDGH